MVQTAIITRYVCDPGDGTSPMSRPMWSLEHMNDAYTVASHIPPDVTALEAAQAFVRWLFDAPREPDDDVILQILIHDLE
ncbi:MAG: hypothetical protein QOH01_2145 [Verrucomicrobiota bacterium]